MRLSTTVILALVPAYVVSMALHPRQTDPTVRILLLHDPRRLMTCSAPNPILEDFSCQLERTMKLVLQCQ